MCRSTTSVCVEENNFCYQRLVETVDISCNACSKVCKLADWSQHITSQCSERIYSCPKCDQVGTIAQLQDVPTHSCVFECAAADVKCIAKNMTHQELMIHHNVCHRYKCANDLRRIRELEIQNERLTAQVKQLQKHQNTQAIPTSVNIIRLTMEEAKNRARLGGADFQEKIKPNCRHCSGTGWNQYCRCFCYLSDSLPAFQCSECEGRGSFFVRGEFCARCACVELPEIRVSSIPENCECCSLICENCNPPPLDIHRISLSTPSSLTLFVLSPIILSMEEVINKQITNEEFLSKCKSNCAQCSGRGMRTSTNIRCYCYLSNFIPDPHCVYCNGHGSHYYMESAFVARCGCVDQPEIRISISSNCDRCNFLGNGDRCPGCNPPAFNIFMDEPVIMEELD